MKTASVLGAGGFIGGHLVTRLKDSGYYVKAVDLRYPEYGNSKADEFHILDLRLPSSMDSAISFGKTGHFVQEVYQLAADMGGAGYIFTKQNDANIMSSSVQINLNLLNSIKSGGVNKVFFSSSACVYPQYNQTDSWHPNCQEVSAYPAMPDSEYGWEKLFSERLYLAYHRNYGVNVRIARFHNIFGPYGAWNNGKEKVPAAICRKVARALQGASVEVWGDGEQTRSFLYIDECLDGVMKLMDSNFVGPVNIGSGEMVTINQLVDLVCDIGKKNLTKSFISGPLGVRGRNSHNDLIYSELGWKPSLPLRYGLEKTYAWISQQTEKEKKVQGTNVKP